MGFLFDGEWIADESRLSGSKGEFNRPESPVRNWVTADGAPGPSGEGGFAAEPGRYHLYVAINCPWAHRAILFRHLKKLEAVISMSCAHPFREDRGWTFVNDGGPWSEHLHGRTYLYELYALADPAYSGRVTVPLLWDKKNSVMVSNESSEIIRMLNSAFDAFTGVKTDYYPEALRGEIDALNQRIYDAVNNGVYRCGYARSQQAYEDAVHPLFETLDWLEERLGKQRYLTGGTITEADWRLFVTLIRFDPAYVVGFKCNLRRLRDYPNLSAYTRDLYQHGGVASTCDIAAYKIGYFNRNDLRNPLGIVPAGPDMDYLNEPHGREAMAA